MSSRPETLEPGRPPGGTAPAARPGILDVPRYTAGKRSTDNGVEPIKLSSNESSFGPSPRAIEAYRSVSGELHRYPDPSQWELRSAIADVHGIDVERIVCGNGSDELLDLLIRAYLSPGDELVLSENHFLMCSIHGRVHGARVVLARERSFRMDVDALLGKVTERTRMLIIANPNNPTGTYLGAVDLARLHAGLPGNVLLVIDGAYAEFATAADFDPGLTLADRAGNVVVTRTFSKIYGLAGLRVGWAYGPAAVMDVLQRVRSPFNTSAAAMAAATAAMRDQDYIAAIRRHNAGWLVRIRKALDRPGVEVVPSEANFYLLHFLPGSGKSAAACAAFLESRGILPRAVSAGETTDVLRITVGLDQENEAVLAALDDFFS